MKDLLFAAPDFKLARVFVSFEKFLIQTSHQNRWWGQHRRGIIPKKVGRERYISASYELRFKQIVEARMDISAVKGSEKLSVLRELKAEQLKEQGKNALSAAPPTLKTARNIMKRQGIKEIKNPSIQTERREEVKQYQHRQDPHPSHTQAGDVYSFLSAAAVAEALFQLPDGPCIPPELVFNIDGTTMKLVRSNHTALVTRKGVNKVHHKHRSVKVTESTEKGRFGHLFPVVSAAGHAACFVAVVHDRALSDVKLQLVRESMH